ncbi:MAG: DUF1559 domain-containing protein [Phycisphaerales bacterium]|jgi:prepilin-type N-terminal cleavage/methylation domain-containing protein/prepilin-type processing-associated H-X9-DG protein|nr:DUF1559 domain-containing protein [Phycisphaerales bacterium]
MKAQTKSFLSEKTAFTLVELLVTIGIISILVAILLPSLNKAREQARAVACASNMRQIGIALMLYTHDNRGFLPNVVVVGDPQSGTGPHLQIWVDLLLRYVGVSNESFFGTPIGTRMMPNNVFACPSVNEPNPLSYGTQTTYTTTTGGWTRSYNSGGESFYASAIYNPRKFSDYGGRASQTALLCDALPNEWGRGSLWMTTSSAEGGVYWYGRDTNRAAPVHKKQLNWLFADGHAVLRPYGPTDIYSGNSEFTPRWLLLK